MFKACSIDLYASIQAWRLWGLLGWIEIRQRYARSAVGPFWLTISMAVVIGSIGTVYGTLFGQKLRDYLPFLSISLLMWGMFAQTINEGCVAYIGSANYIRQAATPKLIFVFQVLWRNVIIFLHNVVIVVLLLAVFGVRNWLYLPLVIPGLLIFLLNAMWLAMICGIVSARFRDLPQIIGALVQVAFYITPIIYRPESLTRFAWIVKYNPLYYLLDLVRTPLMGELPMGNSWLVGIAMAAGGWFFAMLITGRYLKRIPYWV
ncbi:MAG: ABC transporter permease [Janthinobacterium lividum]